MLVTDVRDNPIRRPSSACVIPPFHRRRCATISSPNATYSLLVLSCIKRFIAYDPNLAHVNVTNNVFRVNMYTLKTVFDVDILVILS